jgi:hypothetical protein
MYMIGLQWCILFLGYKEWAKSPEQIKDVIKKSQCMAKMCDLFSYIARHINFFHV